MESPADYLDSPTVDSDDVAFPCKGCGDVNISMNDRFGAYADEDIDSGGR